MFSYQSHRRFEKVRKKGELYKLYEKREEREMINMRQWKYEGEREEYVKHLMSYFGDYIKSEEDIDEAIEAAYLQWKDKWDFKGMGAVRDMLRAKGHDVPFRISYRRRDNG